MMTKKQEEKLNEAIENLIYDCFTSSAKYPTELSLYYDSDDDTFDYYYPTEYASGDFLISVPVAWGYDIETMIKIDGKTYKSNNRKIGDLSMDADFLNERLQLQKILCMVKDAEKEAGIDTTTCFFPLFRQNAKNEDYINTLIAAGYKLINEDHGSTNIAYNCDKYEFIRGDHE